MPRPPGSDGFRMGRGIGRSGRGEVALEAERLESDRADRVEGGVERQTGGVEP